MESLNYEILSSIVNEIYFNCPRVAHNFLILLVYTKILTILSCINVYEYMNTIQCE